jgi:hypothetical protein
VVTSCGPAAVAAQSDGQALLQKQFFGFGWTALIAQCSVISQSRHSLHVCFAAHGGESKCYHLVLWMLVTWPVLVCSLVLLLLDIPSKRTLSRLTHKFGAGRQHQVQCHRVPRSPLQGDCPQDEGDPPPPPLTPPPPAAVAESDRIGAPMGHALQSRREARGAGCWPDGRFWVPIAYPNNQVNPTEAENR